MTFEEIRNTDKDWLVPTDVAGVLQVSAYSISLQARDDPAKLGFPVVRIGSRTKIPRVGFIKYCEAVLGY